MRASSCCAGFLVLMGTLTCGCSSSDTNEDKGIAYCGVSSPPFAGPSGYDWFLFANKGSCATSTCGANDQRVCAKLQSPTQSNAGIAANFGTPLDLSKDSGVEFTAEVKPVGALFDVVLTSAQGQHGLDWALTALAGSTTYRIGFKDGQPYSNDGVAFQLT
ncbi:MAG TPA: hypothetical protein VGC79_35225, partial [Polyangiaceae bacterium]